MIRNKIVYLGGEEDWPTSGSPFRSGDAGLVWLDELGAAESDSRVKISPNSLHALHGHGVVAQLNALEFLMADVGEGSDTVFTPSAVEAVTHIFYEADRMTYGAIHDLHVIDRGSVEYRLLVDNREYQRTLSQLQFLGTTAAHMGFGMRIRI